MVVSPDYEGGVRRRPRALFLASFLPKMPMIEDFELVDTVDQLAKVLAALYPLPNASPSLYLDLEGHDLCRHGRISLISIFAEPLQKTFLIDVHVLGELAFTIPSAVSDEQTLKSLLQDPSIPKVLFDCRNDADALYNIYKVDMKGTLLPPLDIQHVLTAHNIAFVTQV